MLADHDQNVEILRRSIEDFNRRDFDAAAAAAAEDITWKPFLAATETPLLRGKAEVIAAWKSQVELLDLRIETEEFIPVGDKVIAMTRLHTRGTGSTIALERLVAFVATLDSAGLIRGVVTFGSREEALAYAGDPK